MTPWLASTPDRDEWVKSSRVPCIGEHVSLHGVMHRVAVVEWRHDANSRRSRPVLFPVVVLIPKDHD